MAKFKGQGRGLRPGDMRGVQRAHENILDQSRQTQQFAQGMGQAAEGALGDVRRQQQMEEQRRATGEQERLSQERLNLQAGQAGMEAGPQQLPPEVQARLDRQRKEMTEGGLEFTGAGTARGFSPSEASQQATQKKQALAEKKAETERMRAEEYRRQNLVNLARAYQAGPQGDEQAKQILDNLAKEYKGTEKMFNKVASGKATPQDMQTIAAEFQGSPGEQTFQLGGQGPGVPESQLGQPTGQGLGAPVARVAAAVRAKLTHQHLRFTADTGKIPDTAMMDSEGWQQFAQFSQAVRGMIPNMKLPLKFDTIEERNRFINETAAAMTLSGMDPAMADPNMLAGLLPAQQPVPSAGQQGAPDSGGPQQPVVDPLSGQQPPGPSSSEAGPRWSDTR